jgi:hypothetical protein
MKKSIKKIGLWLDHVDAHFIELEDGQEIFETIYSGKESFNRIKGESGNGIKMGNFRSTNNEHQVQMRENEILCDYYKNIAKRLENFDEIFIFGASTAKDELTNLLRKNKHFDDKLIHTESSDQITKNQMIARVRSFFKMELRSNN